MGLLAAMGCDKSPEDPRPRDPPPITKPAPPLLIDEHGLTEAGYTELEKTYTPREVMELYKRFPARRLFKFAESHTDAGDILDFDDRFDERMENLHYVSSPLTKIINTGGTAQIANAYDRKRFGRWDVVHFIEEGVPSAYANDSPSEARRDDITRAYRGDLSLAKFHRYAGLNEKYGTRLTGKDMVKLEQADIPFEATEAAAKKIFIQRSL